MNDKNEETLDELNVAEPAPEVEEVVMSKPKKVEPVKASPEVEAERIASRQRAHELKVAKFLAGGEF